MGQGEASGKRFFGPQREEGEVLQDYILVLHNLGYSAGVVADDGWEGRKMIRVSPQP